MVQLRRFLGMINYYRRHMRNAARSQAPLNELLRDCRKNDKRPVPWTQESIDAFESCRIELSRAALLAHPAEALPLVLSADASDTAIGAALEQICNDKQQPIAFFSRKLNAAQRRYSTYDRELLAVYEAVKYFKEIIQGRRVIIRTDHKPLTYAFQQRLDKASPRQARQLDLIAQFTTEIVHLAGGENTVADTLSRIDAINLPVIVTTEELAEHQANDEELQQLRGTETSLELKELTILGSELPLFCDCSGGTIRPYVPGSLRVFSTQSMVWPIPVARQPVSKCGRNSFGRTRTVTSDVGRGLACSASGARFSAMYTCCPRGFQRRIAASIKSTSILLVHCRR